MFCLFYRIQIILRTTCSTPVWFFLCLISFGCQLEPHPDTKNNPAEKITFQSDMFEKGNYLEVLKLGGKHKCGSNFVELIIKDSNDMGGVNNDDNKPILVLKDKVIHFTDIKKNEIQDIRCMNFKNNAGPDIRDLYVRLWDGGNGYSSYTSHAYTLYGNMILKLGEFVDPFVVEQQFNFPQPIGEVIFSKKTSNFSNN